MVQVNLMLGGYVGALYRLGQALDEHDSNAAFRALFEALNWAVAVDDRISQHWVPEGKPLRQAWRARVPNAEVMAGVRFARNRVHHDWANAIRLDSSSAWHWRRRDELPAGRNPEGEDVYRKQLEGQPVERTLLLLAQAFENVGQLLEPPRPRPLS